MKVTGACHCGKVSYEAQVNPDHATICHCDDCQAFSGAPYRASVPVKAEDFILHGEPTVYIKTADSGTKRAQAFCPVCGSPIYASAPENPPVLMLRLGTVKERAQLVPKRQIWCDSAMPWIDDLKAIPGVPQG